METIALVLIFLSIVCCVWSIGRAAINSNEEESARPRNAFGVLTHPLAFVLPISDKKKTQLKKELISAGHYNTNALKNFLARRNVAVMMCLFAMGFVLATELLPSKEVSVHAIGFSLAIMIYSLPRLVLASKSKSRSKRIENALPDALDMVSMSIEGGVPLQKSLKLVATEFQLTHVDLSRELMIIARQTETGSLDTALEQFATRLDLPEVVAWSAMLKQSQRLGVRMVDAMRDYADRIRENRKQKAELAGQTATVKLLLPVVLCLAPPIFILLIGPAILDFRDFINREKDTGAELIEEANELARVSSRLQDSNNTIDLR